MNADSENHEPASAEELSDRLLDRALAEVVGGETPPDLSGLILAERRPSLALSDAAETAAGGRRLGRRFWVTLAVAAMLLVAAVPLLRPSILSYRDSLVGDADRQKSDGADTSSGALVALVQSSIGNDTWTDGTSRVNREGQGTKDAHSLVDDIYPFGAESQKPVGEEETAKAIGIALYGRSEPVGTKVVGVLPPPAMNGPATYEKMPAPIIPGESQAVQGGKPGALRAINAAQERGLLGPVQIQYLEGANLVIIRGREADAAKALKAIEQTQRDMGYQGMLSSTEQKNQMVGPKEYTSNGPKLVNEFPRFTSDIDVPFRQKSFELTVSDSKSMAVGESGNGNGAIPFPDQGVAGPGPDLTIGSSDLSENFAVHTLPGVSAASIKSALEGRPLSQPVSGVDPFADGSGQLGGQALRPDKKTDLGTGPGLSGDRYVKIYENPFIKAQGGAAVSTFSIDVDTASYTNVRRFLLQENTLPPPDAVRLEELVNYFKYDYAPPKMLDGEDKAGPPAPFAAHLEVAGCPWQPEHRLVRIGIKGQEMDRRERPKSNLVFLVDVSGSMSEPSKLPLVIDGLRELARELGENDRVAIVVYAQQEGLALPSTKGNDHATILGALGQLRSGGSTAGGAGIQLAYQVAEDNFIKGGTNRVILCTDGDFNVGVTSTADLQTLVEKKAKDTGVFLSVLGFGRGNLNDQMMETIADHGNGNYHYVDSLKEARRVFVEEMSGTLVTIAKDVKIQVEFNPKQVAGYRLLGYENRMLRTEDFNDDKKDAGEIGAGHTVTALYEIVPAGKPVDLPPVDDLIFQQPAAHTATDAAADAKAADLSRKLLRLKMKYKRPDADKSEEALSWFLTDEGKTFGAASTDFQFASAVAGFGMLLRDSQYKGNLTYAAAIELAQGGVGSDEQGYRRELVEMIGKAGQLRGE